MLTVAMSRKASRCCGSNPVRFLNRRLQLGGGGQHRSGVGFVRQAERRQDLSIHGSLLVMCDSQAWGQEWRLQLFWSGS
jgi:hypothetical protein